MIKPSSGLRDRRRRQTARDIQRATLMLIRERGCTNVTTEMIATAAGISLRTFFNYYPNKEAAAVGPPAFLSPDDLAGFAAGTGPLAQDFADLIQAQLHEGNALRETIQTIESVVADTPSVAQAFDLSLAALKSQLAGAVMQRPGLGDPVLAQLVAELLAAALARAIREWANTDSLSPEQSMARMAEDLRRVGAALAP